MDLLWENASPTSKFAAQTISVDLSKYSHVYIECTYLGASVFFCPLSDSDFIGSASYYGTEKENVIFGRTIFAGKAGISFKDAKRYGSETDQNIHLVPTRIYGVNGIV